MIERGAGERNNVINKSVNWSSVLNSQRSPQNAMITVKQTPRNEKDMKSMKVTMAKNSKFN